MRVLTAPDGRAFVMADRGIVELSIRTHDDLDAFKSALAAATCRADVKEAVAAIIVSIHHLDQIYP